MAVVTRPSLCATKSSPTPLPPVEQTLRHAASIWNWAQRRRQHEASAAHPDLPMSTWVFRAAIGIWLLGRELAIDCKGSLETSTAHQARRVQAQKRLTWNLGTCQVVLTNLVYVFESFLEAAAGPAVPLVLPASDMPQSREWGN